jgi:parallel beta-helix repeat protein
MVMSNCFLDELNRNRRRKIKAILCLLLCISSPVFSEDPTYYVTSLEDAIPAPLGSLRSAIEESNARPPTSTERNIIDFSLVTGEIMPIKPVTPLPTITVPVVINGYSAPLADPNAQNFGDWDGVIKIEINGNNYQTGDRTTAIGLKLGDGADGSLIQGIAFTEWLFCGIFVEAKNCTIKGNFVGIDAAGTELKANASGIVISEPQGDFFSNATIGGNSEADRNVIVGSFAPFESNAAVVLRNVSGVIFKHNSIGTNPEGTASFATENNMYHGLRMENVFNGNIINNVISRCTGLGIQVFSCTNNTIQGNRIGANWQYDTAIPNKVGGIALSDPLNYGCRLNLIKSNWIGGSRDTMGGTYYGGGNGIIVGDFFGVIGGTTQNVITNNLIGGLTAELGNWGNGIILADNNNSVISNTIIRNGQNGILISSSCSENSITGNKIGFDTSDPHMPPKAQPNLRDPVVTAGWKEYELIELGHR